MTRNNRSDKPDWIPPWSVKLLDQVRERVRYLHYSLQAEKAYVDRDREPECGCLSMVRFVIWRMPTIRREIRHTLAL